MNASTASQETLAALRAELGAEPPEGLSALSDDALRHLLDSIRAQKAQQRAALDSAITQGLTVVPTLLRGAVRKILFKGG
ncbi:MAG: hypothetical protein H6725_15880 [Sandaracinaceae bacterium]|nr:hypothetical protein [Sandaracinaceae bacterium]